MGGPAEARDPRSTLQPPFVTVLGTGCFQSRDSVRSQSKSRGSLSSRSIFIFSAQAHTIGHEEGGRGVHTSFFKSSTS